MDTFAECAALIEAADGLLVTAGAGMGVDAGLPDFRGTQGFWRAYPALAQAGIRFEQVASPQTFRDDPALAWGFYGHRLKLYRGTAPHAGYRLLREWCGAKPRGGFVFTSNVDGLFQKAGFGGEQVYECHGSIHHLQCLDDCRGTLWRADALAPAVDEARCRLTSPPPTCPHCGALARPNILMFGDAEWLDTRATLQQAQLRQWLETVDAPAVIELGAGTAIPTVRAFGERLGAPLIRINPTEPALGRARGVALASGALAALRGIDAALRR